MSYSSLFVATKCIHTDEIISIVECESEYMQETEAEDFVKHAYEKFWNANTPIEYPDVQFSKDGNDEVDSVEFVQSNGSDEWQGFALTITHKSDQYFNNGETDFVVIKGTMQH